MKFEVETRDMPDGTRVFTVVGATDGHRLSYICGTQMTAYALQSFLNHRIIGIEIDKEKP